MNIVAYLRLLWFRYPTRGEERILARLDDIERKIDGLTAQEISPEFGDWLVRRLRQASSAVKRVATDD